MQVVLLKTKSSADTHMRKFSGTILVLLLSMLTNACATSGYFIPPSSPPTQVAFNEPQSGSQEAQPTPIHFQDPRVTDSPGMISSDRETQEALIVTPAYNNPTATPAIATLETGPIMYYAQSADTLPVVAVRFGIEPDEISSSLSIPERDFIDPNQLLIIPRRLADTTPAQKILPDSEFVYSPSAASFDVVKFVTEAGGKLSEHREWHKSTGVKSGAQVLQRVATENSINPRLLLALLEYHNNWVYGDPPDSGERVNPLGIDLLTERGLYNQLVWAVNQLSIGYYGYREGRMTEIEFADGSSKRLAPDLNAGTAALQHYFAQVFTPQQWANALNPDEGFMATHAAMFGDSQVRAHSVEPLFYPDIQQPELILPFERDWTWAYTGGPHGAWERDGAFAGLDFAPGNTSSGCVESSAWSLAAAPGLVVRTGPGLVVLDLDGDGHEQTGWVLVYLHVAAQDRIPLGSWVARGDPLGHASCEGGLATGTHVHIARKYNGEWVPADGPLPFNLGGWIAHAGSAPYKGTLTRDGSTVIANTSSNASSFVTRGDDDL